VSNTDSFIEEVTEEVRRDRLFALMRRYGWIALTAVLIAVGGAAWNEYRKASQRAAAEALGDAILAARDTGAPAEALAGVEAGTPAGAALVALLRADALADAGDTQAALAVLDGVDAAAGQVYAQLAALKALILRGPDMDPAQFRIGMGALAVFAVGWFVYLALRVRHYLDLLEQRPPVGRHTGFDGDDDPEDGGGTVR